MKLLCVENTHKIGGGSIWPLQQMEAAAATARKHGLAVHLDGARLWHASAKTGIPEAQYSAGFDTVSVCFSKALGAPATVETNIVRFRLRGISAGQFVEEAHRLGVHMLPSGPNAVPAVFYLDITDSHVEHASELVGEALRHLEHQPEESRIAVTAQY